MKNTIDIITGTVEEVLIDMSMLQDVVKATEEKSHFLVSTLGIGNIAGRLLVGWVADTGAVSPLTIYALGCLGSAVCNVAYPFVHAYGLMAVLTVGHGLFMAAYISTLTLAALELFGLSKVNFASGMLQIFFGAASTFGPPLMSAIFDSLGQDFVPTLIIVASVYGLASVIALSCQWVNKLRNHS